VSRSWRRLATSKPAWRFGFDGDDDADNALSRLSYPWAAASDSFQGALRLFDSLNDAVSSYEEGDKKSPLPWRLPLDESRESSSL
jgi:hypothetical protein